MPRINSGIQNNNPQLGNPLPQDSFSETVLSTILGTFPSSFSSVFQRLVTPGERHNRNQDLHFLINRYFNSIEHASQNAQGLFSIFEQMHDWRREYSFTDPQGELPSREIFDLMNETLEEGTSSDSDSERNSSSNSERASLLRGLSLNSRNSGSSEEELL